MTASQANEKANRQRKALKQRSCTWRNSRAGNGCLGAAHHRSTHKGKVLWMKEQLRQAAAVGGLFHFKNGPSDHNHQRVVELIDPMKSKETAGWLAGELRAPN
jgi:hypothetical protein